MMDKRSFHPGLRIALTGLGLLFGILSGCNMPQHGDVTPQNVNVTQAYQTVEARLTAAVTGTAELLPTTTATDSSNTPATTTRPLLTVTATAPETVKPSTAPDACDLAAPGIPIDITIPDDTKMQPGQAFTKVWRLKNAGTCTWQPNYQVVLFSGEAMGSPASFPLGQKVNPGQNVEISADMEAPENAGTYQGNWKLRNQAGDTFGIGPNGSSSFWVRIIVVPLPTLTPTPATTTPTSTVTPTEAVQISGQVTIIPGETLDLDNNGVNLDSGEDLVYESTPNGNHQLTPVGSVILAIYGQEQPSLADCQAMSLANESLKVDAKIGQYFCYRTDHGLPGQAQIDYLDPDNYSLRLRILTWMVP